MRQVMQGLVESAPARPPPVGVGNKGGDAPRVHVVVARWAEVHVAPRAGGLPADVAVPAGSQADEGEAVQVAVSHVRGGHEAGEAEARLVDVEVAPAAAVPGAGDHELACVAEVRGCLAVVVSF